ncbi:hypothetical protein [Lysinibacillus fusiformis]|nr:hypothetical protein [Lysinibacillus fusiformis]MDC6266535.1 hypothetical protein [Lysinibacillus sphaericus]MDN4970410.1 hypothetical protein [Lysinibacillus fusiformis]
MTKRVFTKKEQEQLNCNPNVQAVSDKGRLLILKNLNAILLQKM